MERVEPSIWINRVEKQLKNTPPKQVIDKDYLHDYLLNLKIMGVKATPANTSLWKYLRELQETCHRDHTEDEAIGLQSVK
jgi:hypothetical protein